ncbi:hypothetical protein BJ742DRAFT_568495 [Cladochytrium replicatum]|nr:hypothetical protein BJ742DRAFT_568495 [Cladochytrium replicatum]
MMSNKPPPPPPENYLIEQVSMGTVPNSTIGGEVWRHLSGNENFGVAVVNRVLSLNGASAILMHKGNDTWLLEIESGTNVSYVTPYTANSVLALRTTTDAVSLAEYSVGPDRGTKATPLSLFNLTNITSAAFRHPVREASMYLSLKNMSHVYVSLGDSSLKTWVYRLQLPSLVVDRNSTITPASLRGTYRFAESAGYADPDSDGISGILMLASEPAPLVYDAYGMLQPRNLSLLVSPRYLFPYNFMGAPSRGSMSADGATGVILGDRKLVAEDSERVTRTNESSIWSGQMFELFPKYFWEYEQTSYGGGALTDVLAHSSSFFTLRGFDDGVEVHQARDSSSKKKDTFKYSFRRTGITVESLASAGSGAFYVLGTWESEVSIKKYTFRSSS